MQINLHETTNEMILPLGSKYIVGDMVIYYLKAEDYIPLFKTIYFSPFKGKFPMKGKGKKIGIPLSYFKKGQYGFVMLFEPIK